jgi:Fe-S-cluster containining protein
MLKNIILIDSLWFYFYSDKMIKDCFRCGVCCSKYQVQLNYIDARKIADGLGISWDDFSTEYIDPRWDSVNSSLLRHKEGACIFLKRNSNRREALCSIHSFKPSSCLEWTMDIFRKECVHGLKETWGLSVDGEGEVAGEDENLERFRAFINSITQN